jgi:hypothetical protein
MAGAGHLPRGGVVVEVGTLSEGADAHTRGLAAQHPGQAELIGGAQEVVDLGHFLG